MKNQIIIHAAANQTRVALIENGELAQLFIESPENQRTVGNIYLAEVHKVMAGIRAAFINMGTQKDAFLHFSDTGEHLENYLIMLNGKDALPDRSKQEEKAKQIKNTGNGSVTEEQNRMGALLAPKQKVLVQIVKEPIGSKGPRVSTNITVAGRFLVLIPMGEYVAVSKRIRSHKDAGGCGRAYPPSCLKVSALLSEHWLTGRPKRHFTKISRMCSTNGTPFSKNSKKPSLRPFCIRIWT